MHCIIQPGPTFMWPTSGSSIKEEQGSMTDITYRLCMQRKLCISPHNIQKHANWTTGTKQAEMWTGIHHRLRLVLCTGVKQRTQCFTWVQHMTLFSFASDQSYLAISKCLRPCVNPTAVWHIPMLTKRMECTVYSKRHQPRHWFTVCTKAVQSQGRRVQTLTRRV